MYWKHKTRFLSIASFERISCFGENGHVLPGETFFFLYCHCLYKSIASVRQVGISCVYWLSIYASILLHNIVKLPWAPHPHGLSIEAIEADNFYFKINFLATMCRFWAIWPLRTIEEVYYSSSRPPAVDVSPFFLTPRVSAKHNIHLLKLWGIQFVFTLKGSWEFYFRSSGICFLYFSETSWVICWS